MKYLITDPCYIVPNSEWDAFVRKLYTDSNFLITRTNVLPYKVESVGTIIELDNTENGDGSFAYDDGQEVGVDAGLVCLVELDEGYDHKTMWNGIGKGVSTVWPGGLGAVVDNVKDAYAYYRQARTI